MGHKLERRVADSTRRTRRLRCATPRKGTPSTRLGVEGATHFSGWRRRNLPHAGENGGNRYDKGNEPRHQ